MFLLQSRCARFVAGLALTLLIHKPLFAGFVISTPAGLGVGDSFRVMFVTSSNVPTQRNADIAYYDSFVTAAAAGITYSGQTLSWKVIGSTESIAARDHIGIGVNPTGISIFNLDGGLKVAASEIFWGNHQSATLNEFGQTELGRVATGTGSFGSAAEYVLGGTKDTTLVAYGVAQAIDGDWLIKSFGSQAARLYGISDVIVVTAVPEPTSLILWGLAFTGLAFSSVRRRATSTPKL